MALSRDESERLARAIRELGLLIEVAAAPEPEPEPREIEISPQRIHRAKALRHLEKSLEELHQHVDVIQQKMSEIEFTVQLIKASESNR